MTDDWARAVLARASVGSLDCDPPQQVLERLPGSTNAPGSAWSRLVRVAHQGRVLPALGRLTEAGAWATAEQRSVARGLWADAMRHALRVEGVAAWSADRLGELGIEFRVLKGVASAHIDHHRPEQRQFGDLDLLVRGEDLPRVVAVYESQGWTRRFPEPRPGFDRRFTKSVSLSGPAEVDVHRMIVDRPLGSRLPLDELWAQSTSFIVGGVSLQALSAADRLIHASAHAVLGPPPIRLSTMSDIGCLLVSATTDPEHVFERAERWGLRHVVAEAVTRTVSLVWWPDGVDPGWSSEVAPSLGDSVLEASHRRSESSAVRSALAMATVGGWSDRVAYGASLVAPSSTSMSSRLRRGRRAAAQWRAAWRRP